MSDVERWQKIAADKSNPDSEKFDGYLADFYLNSLEDLYKLLEESQ